MKIASFTFQIEKVIFEANEKDNFQIFKCQKKRFIFSKPTFQKMSSKKFSRRPMNDPTPGNPTKSILADTMVTFSERLERY